LIDFFRKTEGAKTDNPSPVSVGEVSMTELGEAGVGGGGSWGRRE